MAENRDTDHMRESNQTAFITAVLLDLHCILFAIELVFAELSKAFGK